MEAEEGVTIAGEGNVLMATETAVMQPQAEEGQQLTEPGTGGTGSLPGL